MNFQQATLIFGLVLINLLTESTAGLLTRLRGLFASPS